MGSIGKRSFLSRMEIDRGDLLFGSRGKDGLADPSQPTAVDLGLQV
jgi:hypothetical protein